MKIRRFNEANVIRKINGLKPTDKVVRLTFSGTLDVLLEEIEKTNYYINYIGLDEDKDGVISYALEEYLYNSGESSNFYDWKLYDGNGNPIEDEKMFDTSIKYNVL